MLVVPLLAVSLVGCGSSDKVVSTGSQASATASGVVATGSASASPSTCPTKATKSFAKTRFAADMGLAFGTFYRWIYKPFQAGTFKAGADGRKTAIAKGAAAGLFTVNRLNAARKLVSADPTLCKYLKAPFDKVTESIQSAVNGLKSGDTSAIAGAGAAIEQARKAAQDSGVNITDRSTGF
ncbi:hypothetical protein [Actinocorallia longicatena]